LSPSLRIQVTDLASEQIREAVGWWAENRPDIRSRLPEELEAAFKLLVFQPFAGNAVPDCDAPGIRRILLKKTQHHLYYRIDADDAAVIVLAFWSKSRGSSPEL
jgi:plasmid stabilization system protein ParE